MTPIALLIPTAFATEPAHRSKGEARFVVLEVPPGEADIEVVGQGSGVQSVPELWHSVAASGRTLVAATNAGMYDADHAPVGLFVESGQLRQELDVGTAPGNFYLKPNGVFWIDAQGPHVAETEAYRKAEPRDVRSATQSGPLLVASGKLHPAISADSPNRLLRNGVGVSPDGTVYLVISDGPTTFHELATLFRDDLGCPDALYLDGVVSTLVTPGVRYGSRAERWAGFILVTAR